MQKTSDTIVEISDAAFRDHKKKMRKWKIHILIIALAVLLLICGHANQTDSPPLSRIQKPPKRYKIRFDPLKVKPDPKASVAQKPAWPFHREDIKKGLTEMLDAWGETAFEADDELVRHVCYFYKYYAIAYSAYSNSTIRRGRRYLPHITKVFEKYDLPKEVAFALPFVESSFDPEAVSGKGAVGIFQFMEETAALYGLEVTQENDERRDYQKSAVACAKYLRNNRNLFASLVYSLGSYHHGTGKVSQILLSTAHRGKRNFRSVFSHRRLGRHSKEYIPQCLAVALICKFMAERELRLIPEIISEKRILTSTTEVETLRNELPDLCALNPDLQGAVKTYPYVSKTGYVLVSSVEARINGETDSLFSVGQ